MSFYLGAVKRYLTRKDDSIVNPSPTIKGLKFDGRTKSDPPVYSVVIEQKPQKRTLLTVHPDDLMYSTSNLHRRSDYKSYFVSFPYTVFIIKYLQTQDFGNFFNNNFIFNSLYVGFSRCSLVSAKDYLWKMPLANYYPRTFRVCLGDQFSSDVSQSSSLAELTNKVISHYWQSKFILPPKRLKLHTPRPAHLVANIAEDTKFYRARI